MRGLGRITAGIGAAVAGLGAAVFLNPRRGAKNRHAAAGVARRQTASVATMVGASVGRTSKRGARHDALLAERVRTAISESHPAAEPPQVVVYKGTVTLRGEVSRLREIEALELTARSVDGVADVNNLLRLAATAIAAK
jgi:osmotically-inducible protein OsmY